MAVPLEIRTRDSWSALFVKTWYAVGIPRASIIRKWKSRFKMNNEILKLCSIRLMPPRKKLDPIMRERLAMICPMREVRTSCVWFCTRATTVTTSCTVLLASVSYWSVMHPHCFLGTQSTHLKATMTAMDLNPLRRRISSSVQLEIMSPRGRMATKLTAKVVAGLLLAYLI
jgi:hypothetical protein